MVGPKKENLINILKDGFFNPLMNYGLLKSEKIVLSVSIFDVKNQPNFI